MLFPSKIKSRALALFLLFTFLNSLTLPVFGFYSKFIVPAHEHEENFLKNIDNTTDILAALIASDVEPQNYSFYASEIERWKKEIEESLPSGHTQHQIAQAIGYYLHDKVYKAYKLSATTLKEVFESRHFNCLSGTVLMNIMLRSFGIEAKAIILPSHAYTFATLDGRLVEIENTIREGMAISTDQNTQDQFNKLTGFNYKNANQKKVVLGWTETVGLLYSNRSYFNDKNKNYAQAFQNMIKAQVFLANSPSEQYNLHTGYLNYSSYIYNHKKRQGSVQDYLKTLSILEEGLARFPQQQVKLKGNYLAGVEIALEKMIKAKAIEEDIDIFLNSAQVFITPQNYKKLQIMRYDRTSMHYLKTNQDLIAAKKNIKNLWEYDKKYRNIKFLIQELSKAFVLDSARNPNNLTENFEFIDFISEFPEDLIQDSLGNYYTKLAENNFNAKKFDDAVQIMVKGREKLGNTRLIKDNGFIVSANSAQYFIDSKEYLKAIEFYKYALDFKNDRNTIHNLGVTYAQTISQYLSENKTKQALELVTESKKFTPNHPSLRDIYKKYS